jgi:hypothetical protein
MSAWRNKDVTKVHALPLSRLSPLKARYVRNTSGFENQKSSETRMHPMITMLIFLNFAPEVSIAL